MVLTTSINRVQFDGDGVTTVFAYPFLIILKTDLVVKKITISTGQEETLAVDVDYTVSGVGLQAGGNVTLTGSAPSDLFKIDIERVMPFTQLLDLIVNGSVPNDTFEESLDKIVMLCQQLKNDVDLAATFSSLQTTAVEFPALSTGPGFFFTDGTTITIADQVVTTTSYGRTMSFGLAAARPANPVAGDLWVEFDTSSFYASYTNGSWTKVNLDISAFTAKASPVDADILAIEDSADSFNKKKITVSSLSTKIAADVATTVGAKDAISRGFELVYNTNTTLDINPGTLYHGTTVINSTAVETLTIGTAADWFDGSQETYAGGAGWNYIGVDSSGNKKWLGSNPPDVDDTAGNTGGVPLYFDDTGGTSGEYWRVIGAVHMSVADQIDIKFYQKGPIVWYDTLQSVLAGGSDAGFTDVDCTALVPAIAEEIRVLVEAGGATVGTLFARPNGSTAADGTYATIMEASTEEGDFLIYAPSQIFEYKYSGGSSVNLDINGYTLHGLR